MTETLKSLMEQQADAVAFKPPDLELIAQRHRRRVRRRRAVTALSAFVVLVLGVGTVAVMSGRGPEVVANPAVAEVSYAVGTTIHHGFDSLSVGHRVRAFVRTSAGFVTIDDNDKVYSVAGQEVRQIGQALTPPPDGDHVRLVSDARGSLAGWIGVGSSGLVFQVHDQATGQTRDYEADAASAFFAIDNGTAYWRTSGGAFAVDLSSGEKRLIADGEEARELAIWSVSNGMLAFTRHQQRGANVLSINVGRSLDQAREITFPENAESDDLIRLSPTGAWISHLLYQFDGPPIQDKVQAFLALVRDTATGEPVPLGLPQKTFAVPVVWLDDNTLQVMVVGASEREGNMSICDIAARSCTVAVELPPTALEGSALVMPNGRWIRE
jgi:hypothetical protein